MISFKALILVAFLPIFVAAQTNEVGADFREFSGGLNQVVEPSKLKPEYSPDMLNVLVDETIGALRPRRGFTRCGNTPSGNAATRLYEYVKSNGTRRLIVSDNATIWQTADCVAFTAIVSGLADNVPDFATVRDNLWIVNRSTHALVWDGTTLTTLDARASTPNPKPPACAYLEFWRERVWCARTSANPSDVAFSALTDSSGNDITPSTGSAAWPATNVIAVDQDSGCPIYGIKAYQDNLYVFKGECGIFRIAFENDFNNAVIKTLASVGAKFHTGIAEGDGLLHFIGPDGIYVWDGAQNIVRISDVIPTTFDALRQPSAGEGLSVWTTRADFEHASAVIFQATTTLNIGSIDLATRAAIISNGGFETGSFTNFTISSAGVFQAAGTGISVAGALAIVGSFGSGILAIAAPSECSLSVVSAAGSTLTSRDHGGQQAITTHTVDTSDFVGQSARLHFRVVAGDIGSIWSDALTLGTAITYQTRMDCVGPGNSERGFEQLDNIQNHTFYSSGTFTSEIRDIGVTISSWSTFDTEQDLAGGSISYMVRVGSNTGAVNARPWVDIIPGAVITGTTSQTFIQWTATYTYAAPGPHRTNSVTFNYLTGDLSDAPIYGHFWKNRFWITAASGTSTTNNVVLVKSRTPSLSLVPFDLQINDMARFNNNFYASASTHSAIYRLDIGANDNGAAIQWHWTSREEDFGSPYTRKVLKEIILDHRNSSASNLKLGYKTNASATYTESTINANATDGRETERLNISGGSYSHGFQLRVRDQTLDETGHIIGISAYAIPGRQRE